MDNQDLPVLQMAVPLPDRAPGEPHRLPRLREPPMIRDVLHVASPGMHPPWSGRPRLLTRDETLILVLAATGTGRLAYRDVCAVIGGEPWSKLNSLKNAGALAHHRYNHWEITEKGRIAAALALTKDPKLAEAVS